MDIINFDTHIDLAKKAAKEAGKLLQENRNQLNKSLASSKKDTKLLADLKAEDLIKDILDKGSEYPILAEESGKSAKDLGDVLFNEVRDKFALLGGLVGPIGVTTADVLMAIKHGTRLEFSKASKSAYDAVTAMIPFYNLFYIKSAFDYMIGYQIMETIKRVSNPRPSRPRTVFKTGCKMYYLILKINMGPLLGPINLIAI